MGNKVTKDIKRFCGSCLTVISPGCSHKCNREQRVQNIKKLVSPTTLSRLAYESVKDDLSSNGEATLRSTGRPLTISNAKAKKEENNNVLPAKVMQNIKVEGNFSGRQMPCIEKNVRKRKKHGTEVN